MIKNVYLKTAAAIFVLAPVLCVAQGLNVDDQPAKTPAADDGVGSISPAVATQLPGTQFGNNPQPVPSYAPAGSAATVPAQPGTIQAQQPNGLQPQQTETITIQYTVKRPVKSQVRSADGKVTEIVQYVMQTESATIDVAGDLKDLALPPEGKRVAVLAVTAARHHKLLDALKEAEIPEKKEAASAALKENYTEHYAVETWWREQKLSELETRLKELRDQVTQRQEAEEKYVDAAMTIAELWADGIGITPPTPSHQPVGSPLVPPLPGPTTTIKPSAISPNVYGPGLQPRSVPSRYGALQSAPQFNSRPATVN